MKFDTFSRRFSSLIHFNHAAKQLSRHRTVAKDERQFPNPKQFPKLIRTQFASANAQIQLSKSFIYVVWIILLLLAAAAAAKLSETRNAKMIFRQ